MEEEGQKQDRSEFDLFQEACELPTEERDAFLNRACGGNAALREGVRKLLQCMGDSSDEFLERAAYISDRDDAVLEAGERPGSRIGNYRLEELIGEGGFGVVFRAEQIEPLRRKAAIKIIKPGMETKEVVKRFEAERQALAGLDHPGITKVFDAGTTEHGRPYFVMELVDGVPVNQFCNAEQLTLTERMSLFCDICDAVQHAHDRGIVHRDLKPSNILAKKDGDHFRVKVIDFGVAKVLSRELTEQTLSTALGQVIGTLQYMSPEQSAPGTDDLDCRTDVYALGVILYELLVDRTPLDSERMRRAGFDEILRMIREENPPRPSTRIGKLTEEETNALAATRGEDSERLKKQLRGGLDWIVMKALAKERERRYPSVGDFAADLSRFLTHQPVSARPPSAVYRIQTFTRRNRTVLRSVVATCLIVALVLGLMRFAESMKEAKRAGGFGAIDTASAPNYTVAAHSYLRESYGIALSDVTPPGSKVVFRNNLAIYNGDAVDPGETQNFLTQIDARGKIPSYTMKFEKGLTAFRFTRPALFPATESGVTHPAWKVTAMNESNEEVGSAGEEMIRSFINVPPGTFEIEAREGEVIRSVRVDSNNRLNDVPFAAFEALLIESIKLVPATK